MGMQPHRSSGALMQIERSKSGYRGCIADFFDGATFGRWIAQRLHLIVVFRQLRAPVDSSTSMRLAAL